jgi:hypothetical protein
VNESEISFSPHEEYRNYYQKFSIYQLKMSERRVVMAAM